MIYRRVLVIGASSEYLNEVSDVLAEVGAAGVLVGDAEAAANALHEGFDPEIVLLDPMLVGAPEAEDVVVLLRKSPQLATVPVLAISSPPLPGNVQRERQHVDRAALTSALQRLDAAGDGAASPQP